MMIRVQEEINKKQQHNLKNLSGTLDGCYLDISFAS